MIWRYEGLFWNPEGWFESAKPHLEFFRLVWKCKNSLEILQHGLEVKRFLWNPGGLEVQKLCNLGEPFGRAQAIFPGSRFALEKSLCTFSYSSVGAFRDV